MSHTKEPWILRQGNEIGVADKSDTQSYGMLNVIARVDKYDFENWQENARRIVACVNACKHFTTEELEQVGEHFSGVLVDTKLRCAELVSERDELLETLKSVLGRLQWIDDPRTGSTEKPWIKMCEKLIKKLEQQS